MKPSWLLDIDGVINPVGRKPPTNIHKEWLEERVVAAGTGREFPIKIAVPVIEFINEVHADDLVDIIWHTTWQHGANDISRIFGLPEFPVLDAPEFAAWSHRTAQGWWKTPAVQRHLDSTTAPTLWTDDDLDMGWHEEMSSPHGLTVIAPDQYTGFTKKHLDQIENFLLHENGLT